MYQSPSFHTSELSALININIMKNCLIEDFLNLFDTYIELRSHILSIDQIDLIPIVKSLYFTPALEKKFPYTNLFMQIRKGTFTINITVIK